MTTATAGQIIESGQTIEADGDYYVSVRGEVSLTLEGAFGGGTVLLLPGDQTLSAATTTISGSEAAGYTANFNLGVALGEFKINLAGATAPNITVMISPMYARQSTEAP